MRAHCEAQRLRCVGKKRSSTSAHTMVLSKVLNMDFKEKRSFSRTRVEWPVSIATAQGAIEGKIKNISLAGAYMHVEELPDMTISLDLSMEIPEHQYALFTLAEPVRFDVLPDDDDIVSYGLGVRLMDVTDDDVEFLTTTALR